MSLKMSHLSSSSPDVASLPLSEDDNRNMMWDGFDSRDGDVGCSMSWTAAISSIIHTSKKLDNNHFRRCIHSSGSSDLIQLMGYLQITGKAVLDKQRGCVPTVDLNEKRLVHGFVDATKDPLLVERSSTSVCCLLRWRYHTVVYLHDVPDLRFVSDGLASSQCRGASAY